MEQVVKQIWPFYLVMFAVLMLVTYILSISLWLPHALKLQRGLSRRRRRDGLSGQICLDI